MWFVLYYLVVFTCSYICCHFGGSTMKFMPLLLIGRSLTPVFFACVLFFIPVIGRPLRYNWHVVCFILFSCFHMLLYMLSFWGLDYEVYPSSSHWPIFDPGVFCMCFIFHPSYRSTLEIQLACGLFYTI